MAFNATNLKKVSGIQTFPASVIVKYFIRPATRILTTIIMIMILQAIAQIWYSGKWPGALRVNWVEPFMSALPNLCE